MAQPRTYIDPSDFAGAINDNLSVANGVTASVSSDQAGGYPVTKSVTRVTVAATAGDSLLLPAAKAGDRRTIFNKAANSIDIFPATGEAINALAANAAYALAATKGVILYCVVDGTWDTILTA